jgi:GNAT superfamily N-acetyltransferase
LQTHSKADIRLLTAANVNDALQLSVLAGWNQTADDWRLLLRVAPDGCFCIETDGKVVATATLVAYGKRLAWVGMVLTHPEYRRRGFASLLLKNVLTKADASGIRTLKLDATGEGEPLYAGLGFVREQTVERWERAAIAGASSNTVRPAGIPSSGELDASAFGADRSELLRGLQERGGMLSNEDGFLFSRSGTRTAYLGPCVARNGEAARQLISTAIEAGSEQRWSWDLLRKNQNAVVLATELGFAPQRHLVRMTRGEHMQANDELVYAIAGFEFG